MESTTEPEMKKKEDKNTERAKFIFEQAKDYVSSGVKASDTLDSKAFKIFGYTFVIFNALVAYIFANYNTLSHPILFGLILYAVCLAIANFLLIKAVDLADFYITGNTIENLTDHTVEGLLYEELMMAEARGYTLRSNANKIANDKKVKKIAHALNILIYSLPVVILISLLSWIIF